MKPQVRRTCRTPIPRKRSRGPRPALATAKVDPSRFRHDSVLPESEPAGNVSFQAAREAKTLIIANYKGNGRPLQRGLSLCIVCCAANVASWHIATIPVAPAFVGYWGGADIGRPWRGMPWSQMTRSGPQR